MSPKLESPAIDAKKAKTRFVLTIRVQKHRNYRLWFFAQDLSLIGAWIRAMAQQVFVYRLTGSACALRIVSFMQVVPLIPFGLWGGTLGDRVPKRTASR
jgi:hypothetical protein